jgi:hypothetical protein
MIGINAEIWEGYTGCDHLITAADRDAATDAVAGKKFRRGSDALRAAERAYTENCDPRVKSARVVVRLRLRTREIVVVG